MANWDASAYKTFPFTHREDVNLQFRAEAFNLFNRVQFGYPGLRQGAGNFGVVSGQLNSPRLPQVSLRGELPGADRTEAEQRMRRREFVKAVLAASVSAGTLVGQTAPTQAAPSAPPPIPPGTAPPPAPGPVPWMRGLLEAKPLPLGTVVPDGVAETTTYFFKDRQMATLRQLCEILLPPLGKYPGALDAGTPEFLDFLISVSPPERQRMYEAGLDWLDAEAREKFGKGFDALDEKQADALLRPWLRTWMTDHPPQEAHAHFINVAHSDIRTATVNSEAWHEGDAAEARERGGVGLYWYPVDPDINRRYLPRR